jgi:hypothetical protein
MEDGVPAIEVEVAVNGRAEVLAPEGPGEGSPA